MTDPRSLALRWFDEVWNQRRVETIEEMWAEGAVVRLEGHTGDITRDPRFHELLGSNPDEVFVVGLIWYGYPKILPEQSRKGLDVILTELP